MSERIPTLEEAMGDKAAAHELMAAMQARTTRLMPESPVLRRPNLSWYAFVNLDHVPWFHHNETPERVERDIAA
jgi:hypothetical protein